LRPIIGDAAQTDLRVAIAAVPATLEPGEKQMSLLGFDPRTRGPDVILAGGPAREAGADGRADPTREG
jgi:hypothetical protein